MLTPEERALLMELQEQIIERAVEKDAAQQRGDHALTEALEDEIEKLLENCEALKQTA